MNSDFAKKVGGVDTMEEFREKVRKQLYDGRHGGALNHAKDQVLAKLADGADETAVKEALEAHRQSQHDTFSWYLAQNLPKVEDARILVEDGYVFYLIAENADAGEAAFHAYVEAQA